MNLSTTKKNLAACSPDLRVDLLRGLANWFLFLDHIPHNVVNLLTLRNFGFAGATDVFMFVAGYAATVFFGNMAIERGFLVSTTRIFRRTWQLYAAYVVLFVVYVDIIGNVAVQYAATDIIGRVQRHRHRRPSDADLDARTDPAGEAARSRYAATIRRADGGVSAAFVVHAAAAEPHARRFDRALRRCARVRLEPACLSYGQLVFAIRSAGSSSPCLAPGSPSTARS